MKKGLHRLSRAERRIAGFYGKLERILILNSKMHLHHLTSPNKKIRLAGGKARRQVMFTVVLTYPETGPCMPFLFPGPSPGQALAFG
jgi:hypothetical protein